MGLPVADDCVVDSMSRGARGGMTASLPRTAGDVECIIRIKGRMVWMALMASFVTGVGVYGFTKVELFSQ